MAKNWYFAKCEKCSEVINFFVNDPLYSAVIFNTEERATEIKQWFIKHYGCELKLGWRDDHLDQLWEEGYASSDFNKVK